jgi:hypothetical protein
MKILFFVDSFLAEKKMEFSEPRGHVDSFKKCNFTQMSKIFGLNIVKRS